jgi:ribonuclease P protein component
VLAAANRLRRSVDFAATIRGGRRAARGGVVVHFCLVGGGDPAAAPGAPARAERHLLPPRAGFVVPRAVGGAAVRNLVKRRLRHLVRDRIGSLPHGAMLVVRALPGAAVREYSQLGADLDAALARATTGRKP